MKKILLLSILGLSLHGWSQTLDLDKKFGTNGQIKITTTYLNDNSVYGVFRTVLDQDKNLYIAARPGNNYVALCAKIDSLGNLSQDFGTEGIFKAGTYMSTGVLLGANDDVYLTGFNSIPAPVTVNATTKGVKLSSFGISSAQASIYGSAYMRNAGKIYWAGGQKIGAATYFYVARTHSDGYLDNSFSGDGILTFTLSGWDNKVFHDILELPNGKILVYGHQFKNTVLVRLNSNGTLDPTFGTNGVATLSFGDATYTTYGYSVKARGYDVYVEGGYYNSSKSTGDIFVAKYKNNGTLDSSFGSKGITFLGIGGYSATGWNTLALQPDGSVLFGGNTQSSGLKTVVARLKPNGTPDNSFNAGRHYKVGSSGAYHTILALSDTAFLATNCNVTETYFNFTVEKYKTIPVIHTAQEKADLSTAIKTIYENGAIHVISTESIEEISITDVVGTTKSYTGVTKVPAKDHQAYIVRIKTANGLLTTKVATF